MSDDRRIEIVAKILADKYYQAHFNAPHSMARIILAALDERALVAKWEGARQKFLEEHDVSECWIPQQDVVDYLNKLPGKPVTVADLRAFLVEVYEYHNKPDHDDQVDCLRVYSREKEAGTDLSGIVKAIQDEVLTPAYEKEAEEHEREKQARDEALVESGSEFGFINRFTTGLETPVGKYGYRAKDWYGRFGGQLYRLVHVGNKQYRLLSIKKLGDEGTPTTPELFSKPTEARDAIKAGKVKCAKGTLA